MEVLPSARDINLAAVSPAAQLRAVSAPGQWHLHILVALLPRGSSTLQEDEIGGMGKFIVDGMAQAVGKLDTKKEDDLFKARQLALVPSQTRSPATRLPAFSSA